MYIELPMYTSTPIKLHNKKLDKLKDDYREESLFRRFFKNSKRLIKEIG